MPQFTGCGLSRPWILCLRLRSIPSCKRHTLCCDAVDFRQTSRCYASISSEPRPQFRSSLIEQLRRGTDPPLAFRHSLKQHWCRQTRHLRRRRNRSLKSLLRCNHARQTKREHRNSWFLANRFRVQIQHVFAVNLLQSMEQRYRRVVQSPSPFFHLKSEQQTVQMN